MKTVDLRTKNWSVKSLLSRARKGPVLLKDAKGGKFVLSAAEGFDTEMELLRRNHELSELLERRFKSKKRFSLSDVENSLSQP
jgi:hypothetical protein